MMKNVIFAAALLLPHVPLAQTDQEDLGHHVAQPTILPLSLTKFSSYVISNFTPPTGILHLSS